jgi:hemoglobin
MAKTTDPTNQATLYERLGGKRAITRIVENFLDEFFKHDRIRNPLVVRRHDAAFQPELTRHWIAFVTQNAGGPSTYAGRTMKSAHAGMKISDSDFDLTLEMMAESLDRAEVGAREKKELLAIMSKHRRSIVEPQ